MTAIHAFQQRDFYTCDSCSRRNGNQCTSSGRIIRWRMDRYGCGDYIIRVDADE